MGVIELKDVSKSFKIYGDKGLTLKEKILFRKRNKYESHDVLKKITISIKRSEVIGLIGENGCGKSTLLKLMTKIIYPDQGTIKMEGKISSLLELGAGFHPDMTGRENIFINASIFGLTRTEIEEKLKEIIEFSELEEYIDNPVRTYSSGMYMRLAFSVAINVYADILLIDEILAVGDAIFQRKCFDKISELKGLGKTIVIVSHDLSNLKRLCDKVYWLENGEIKLYGDSEYIIDKYIESSYENMKVKASVKVPDVESEESEPEDEISESGKAEKSDETDENYIGEKQKIEQTAPKRWGKREIEFLSIKILDKVEKEKNNFKYGDSLKIEMVYTKSPNIKDFVIGFGIFLPDGYRCYGTNTEVDSIKLNSAESSNDIQKITLTIDGLYLTNGVYYMNFALHNKDGYVYDYLNRLHSFSIYSSKLDIGIFKPLHKWIVE